VCDWSSTCALPIFNVMNYILLVSQTLTEIFKKQQVITRQNEQNGL